MKKVTILALHLGVGGVEKCICDLANSLSSNYDVEILSIYKLHNKPSFKLNDKVSVKYLLDSSIKPNRNEFKSAVKEKNIFKIFSEGIQSVKCLYKKKHCTIKALKKCDSDYIISTRDYLNTLSGKYGTKKAIKIAWEHNHPHGDINFAMKVANSCKNIDKLVLVSKSLKEYYEDLFQEKNIDCKCVFIPNTIDYIPSTVSPLDNYNIVSVGRLSKEKGFLDLIDVFNIAYKLNDKLHLSIVGDGIEKKKIASKIKEYNLDDAITLHGFLDKTGVNEVLSKSSLYVMTSYTESFGIVLIEAMSHGLPCIAFYDAEGARDLIGDSTLLIKDRNKEKMAHKIVDLLNDRNSLSKIGAKNREFSLKYDSSKVLKLWQKTLR